LFINFTGIGVRCNDALQRRAAKENKLIPARLIMPDDDIRISESVDKALTAHFLKYIFPPIHGFFFCSLFIVAFFATFGVILSACYALWLYRKVIFGVLDKPSLMSIKDLSARELLLFAPLVALTILFGVYPKPVLDLSAASVNALVAQYNKTSQPKSAGLTK
jgi:hypothetical protein